MHVVCAWIGNSEAIAAKHYLQVTDADFEQANLGKATQNPAQYASETARNRQQGAIGEPQICGDLLGVAGGLGSLQVANVGTEGFEPPTPRV